MNSEEKLNLVLSKTNTSDSEKYINARVIRESITNEITTKELDLMLEKLHKDGFVSKFEFPDPNGSQSLPVTVYRITFDGVIFLENLGYVQQKVDRKISIDLAYTTLRRAETNADRLTYGTWFLGFATAALVLWEMIAFYIEHHPYCCCYQ